MKENMRTKLIIIGVLFVVVAVLTVNATVSFFSEIKQPRIELENKSMISITANRTYEIYLEDTQPPTLISYDFTFTDTENQNRITSYAPNSTSTYSVGSVIVNDEIVRGAFGRLVALVDLEEGNYVVEYQPLEGSGLFVWGNDMFTIVFRFIVKILGLSIAGCALLVMFIVIYSRRKKLPDATNESISENEVGGIWDNEDSIR